MKSNTKRTPQGILATFTGLLLVVAICCYYTANAQEAKQPKEKIVHTENVMVKKQRYENNDKDDNMPDMDSIVNNAMNSAKTAISQINWDDVNDAIKQAGKDMSQLDKKEIKFALAKADVEIKRAQNQLQNMDWSAASNSLHSAEKAIASIDWDEISNQVTDAIQSAGVPDSTVSGALRQARMSINNAKIDMQKTNIYTKRMTDSVLNVRKRMIDSIYIDKQRMSDFLSSARQQKRDDIMKKRQAILDEAKGKRDEAPAKAQYTRAIALAQRNADKESADNTDAFLKQLETDGRIDRNNKFKIRYEEGVLVINGKVAPVAIYRKYLPSGKSSTLKITGEKGSLSVSRVENN